MNVQIQHISKAVPAQFRIHITMFASKSRLMEMLNNLVLRRVDSPMRSQVRFDVLDLVRVTTQQENKQNQIRTSVHWQVVRVDPRRMSWIPWFRISDWKIMKMFWKSRKPLIRFLNAWTNHWWLMLRTQLHQSRLVCNIEDKMLKSKRNS